MKTAISSDVNDALDTCLTRLRSAAEPAHLSDQAAEMFKRRYEPMFARNLNKRTVGGWPLVRPRLEHVAEQFGRIAREIALINDGNEIDADIFNSAAEVIERHCRIGMVAAGLEEGLVCG